MDSDRLRPARDGRDAGARNLDKPDRAHEFDEIVDLARRAGQFEDEALDGPLAPIPCASVTAFRPCEDCGDLKTCSVRLIMVEARNAIANVLDRCTLADMRARSSVADRTLMYHI